MLDIIKILIFHFLLLGVPRNIIIILYIIRKVLPTYFLLGNIVLLKPKTYEQSTVATVKKDNLLLLE